jgi:predicted AAA+ superfamily ATPase
VAYVDRLVDNELERVLGAFAAVMVVGPRACGKTTTSMRLAESVVRLDQPAVANVFRFDPDAALAARDEPVLLDEWQDVSAVLGAVKRSVDVDPRPGRFVLTGSVSGEVEAASWPGTGRLIRVPMYGMTVRETIGAVGDRPSLAAVLRGDVRLPSPRPDLLGYLDYALTGGFPEAVRLDSAADRRRWLDSYIDQMVSRDIDRLGERRDANRLRRYLQAWALNSAGVVDDVTIYRAVGLDRRTHVAYEQLLVNMFIGELVPAWSTNRLKRLVRSPKRYVVDPALMAAAARVGRSDVLDDAGLLGRLIDTFVASEIRSHAAVEPSRPQLLHLRTDAGRQEVDLLVEYDGGQMFAVEVKASSVPTLKDGRHLVWLRDQLGDRFAGGVVFHTGPEILELGDRIKAIPICALWGGVA